MLKFYEILFILVLITSHCSCSNLTTIVKQFERKKMDVEVSNSNILSTLSNTSIIECGATCSKSKDCSGFTINKKSEWCNLFDSGLTWVGISLTASEGTNLYILQTVECLEDLDCQTSKDLVCREGKCVQMCQNSRLLKKMVIAQQLGHSNGTYQLHPPFFLGYMSMHLFFMVSTLMIVASQKIIAAF